MDAPGCSRTQTLPWAMFTGLIEHLGVVVSVAPAPSGAGWQGSGGGVRLVVRPEAPSGAVAAARVGDSIAIDGCCLTLAEPVTPDGAMAFIAISQTLGLTTLGGLEPGDRVHMETAATLATLLGGHLVQGHVDGVGVVEQIETDGQWRVRIRPPALLMEYLAPQGSICVAGVSLTIAKIEQPRGGGWFEVALIPTTLAKTTLGMLKAGSRVNLECDAIAKQVVFWLRHHARGGSGAS